MKCYLIKKIFKIIIFQMYLKKGDIKNIKIGFILAYISKAYINLRSKNLI